jgi:signal transduction histidine kinase
LASERAPLEHEAAEAVAALGRIMLDFRLVVLLVSLLALPGGRSAPGPFIVAAFASFIPLMRWSRLAPWLMRHPFALFADVALTVWILWSSGGVDGPFLYYTLGTAFLAGVLYSWAGGLIFSVTLVLGYYLSAYPDPVSALGGFQQLVGTPSLLLLAGIGAAAIRGLLLRMARTEAQLSAAIAATVAGDERARLAREMHDTLAKTLHGIRLTASALPAWVEREPARAARDARNLVGAIDAAACQARDLIAGLRADRLDTPLDEAVRRSVEEWSARAGIPAWLDLAAVDIVLPDARYELFWILREALRNVERHAGAGCVWVGLAAHDGTVVLSIADDGRGLSGPIDLDRLAAADHYGLIGMAERAERAGGRLELRPRHPCGTEVIVQVAVLQAAERTEVHA